jgi:lipopolysaccharide export LptBFGC system permease protein LptF
MTLSELDRQATVAAAAGDRIRSATYAWSFHLRFALSLASLVLAGLLVGVSFNRRTARTLLALLACVAYWSLMQVGEELAVYSSSGPAYRNAGMIPIVGAWLPNIVLAATAVLIASSRSSSLRRPKVAAP